MRQINLEELIKKVDVHCIERKPTEEELNSKESEILMYDEFQDYYV